MVAACLAVPQISYGQVVPTQAFAAAQVQPRPGGRMSPPSKTGQADLRTATGREPASRAFQAGTNCGRQPRLRPLLAEVSQ
jgi:hypothetical protein